MLNNGTGQSEGSLQSGREMFRILGQVVLMAAIYGIIHDQITARIDPAYFNVDHPDLGFPEIFHSASPTVLAFAWGIVATVPLATVLGSMIAISAQAGNYPQISSRQLLKPLLVVFCAMAALAVTGGIWGYHAWTAQSKSFVARREMADFCAHLMSYCGGLLGALALVVYIVVRRRNARHSGA
jgi:tryptophan-rich sensory protein